MPNSDGTPTYAEQIRADTAATVKRETEQLQNEIDRQKVKYSIYSKIPKMGEVAGQVADNIKWLSDYQVSKAKDFGLAGPADNIHAAQGSAEGLSRILDAIAQKNNTNQ